MFPATLEISHIILVDDHSAANAMNSICFDWTLTDCFVIVFYCRHPKFKKITEFEDFHLRMDIKEIPWMSWKSPTSSEYEFLARCHRAGNPEIFFRLIIVINSSISVQLI